MPEEQTIEIWEAGSMRLAFNLKDVDAHGLVYTDGEFGSLHLEPDQPSTLLYIAEKKKPKGGHHPELFTKLTVFVAEPEPMSLSVGAELF